MNRSIVNVLSMGATIALVLSLSACDRDANADPGTAASASADTGVRYGRVVSVDPVRDTTPRRECHDEVVTHTAPPKDQHQIAGMAIGAVAGGLLGNQVGSGKGRTLATVAGAVGGGYAGKRIEQTHQHGQVTQQVEQRCSTVQGDPNKIVAYDVRYEYKGVTRSVRMDHDPGDRVEVQEGVVSVSDAR
ncbi:glycine zipper 2TM domain-containing protein [Dyella sp.]|uniref:glycine zipper 2TM domain-containing protein n=1 Tax=Dyella sp. TaxID=1869338 RepID=UPI002ED4F6C6